MSGMIFLELGPVLSVQNNFILRVISMETVKLDAAIGQIIEIAIIEIIQKINLSGGESTGPK